MRKNVDREGRKNQIAIAMSIARRDHNVEWFSVSQIAKKLDVTTSHHIRKIMNELVEEGVLVKTSEPYRKGWNRSWYRLSTYVPDKIKPIRKVKIGSHKFGQMELPL